MNKIKEVLKHIVYYLMLAYISFAILMFTMTCIDAFDGYIGVPWNVEAMGWTYNSAIHYIGSGFFFIITMLVPLLYSLKIFKTNKKEAYFVLAIPFIYLISVSIYPYKL